MLYPVLLLWLVLVRAISRSKRATDPKVGVLLPTRKSMMSRLQVPAGQLETTNSVSASQSNPPQGQLVYIDKKWPLLVNLPSAAEHMHYQRQ